MNRPNLCAPLGGVRGREPATILALLVLGALSGAASAGPFSVDWYGQANVGTLFYGNGKQNNTGPLTQISYQDNVSYSEDHNSTLGGWSAEADVTGTAALGHLSGIAHSHATNSANLGVGEAQLQMAWTDTFTVALTAKTEPDGYVHLPWSLTLSDTISINYLPSSQVDPAKGSDNSYAFTELEGSAYGIEFLGQQLADSIPNPLKQNTVSGVLLMSPGTTFTMFGGMTVYAEAYAGGTYSGGINGEVDSTVSAPHSADFYLDPDPVTGASYTTASGQDYFTPALAAPEPASMVLSLTGLLGLFGWRVVRRK